MWVKNNDKERVKTYLKSDISSNITNVTDFCNRIHDLISAIDRATAGTPSGTERENYIDQIITLEWVDDEQDRRDYQ